MDSQLVKETIILAPQLVVDKAKQLHKVGLYKQALDILLQNSIQFDVYETYMHCKLPVQKKVVREYNFKSRNK